MKILTHTRLIACAACAVALAVAAGCKQEAVTPDQITAALDSAEVKVEWLDYRINQEEWELATTGRSDSLAFFRRLYHHVVSDAGTWRMLGRGTSLVTEDPEHRRIELLYPRFLTARIESRREIRELKADIERHYRSYRPQFLDALRDRRFVDSVLRFDPDRTRRQQAFRSLKSAGENVAEPIAQLIRLRNQFARQIGYNDFFAVQMATSPLKSADYLQILKQLDSVTAQPYQRVIESMRDRLEQNDIDLWDFEYAYRDVMQRIDAYFPADSQFRFLSRTLDAAGMPLGQTPVYFDLSARRLDPGQFVGFTVRPPYDQRLAGRPIDGIEGFLEFVRETGQLLPATYLTDSPASFEPRPGEIWTDALADMISKPVLSEPWLTQTAGVPAPLAAEFVTAWRELRLLRLRHQMVMMQFEYEAYRNPNRDLNHLYWDLHDRLLQLTRHEDIPLWAAESKLALKPVSLHNDIIAEVIAAQSMDYFQRNYGSPVSNPQLRSYLEQNYYRFGLRYPWPDLLERGTGSELTLQPLAVELQLR